MENPVASRTSIELSRWQATNDLEEGKAIPDPREGLETPGSVQDEVVIQQLQPADGGVAAWRLLIAGFIFEALLFGKYHLSYLFASLMKPQGFQFHSVSSRITIQLYLSSQVTQMLPSSEP
jgi:hypothetical protein